MEPFLLKGCVEDERIFHHRWGQSRWQDVMTSRWSVGERAAAFHVLFFKSNNAIPVYYISCHFGFHYTDISPI